MRGRSLLKETSTPNVCAFCAHRLGQVRRPSHVQRRFLQSSKPVSKPPAEATAERVDHGNRAADSAWGRPSTKKSNGFGVPSAGGWGRPAFGVTNTNDSQSGGNSIWGQPGGTATSNTEAEQPGHGASSIGDSGLLPHEIRAREILLEKKRKRDEEIERSRPKFENDRIERSSPFQADRSHRRMIDVAREAYERKEQRQQVPEAPRSNGEFNIIRGSRSSRGSRHVIGDKDHDTSVTRDTDDTPLPNWSQLRRRNEVPIRTVQVSTREDDTVLKAFAEWEGKATEGYKPLLSSRNVTTSRYPDTKPADVALPATPTPEVPIIASTTPDTAPQEALTSYSPLLAPSSEEDVKSTKEETTQDDTSEKSSREVKKRRGKSQSQGATQSYDDAPRGKGRDKARRREQFDDAGEGADEEHEAALARAEVKRLRKLEKAAKKAAPTPMLLPEYISVSNLAVALHVRFEDFVRQMRRLGFEETTHDHVLNAENAGLIAMEYGYEPIIDRGDSEDLKPREPAQDPSSLPPRPPVVTIMGHVDHGKTTLLDYLRKSSVAASEHGGITQHIGAFSVPMPGGKTITFLDTPGHAAFLSMRQRGANVTDIVILVVAADDSVKPQTIEAINHAKKAKVPMIVAINKIDKEGSNIESVKQDLARHGVDVEDYGGDTQVVCVSGKTGQGMDELEEAAVTLSEILDMRAEQDGPAEGWVLEASIKSMGKVATVLVRRGTMRPGDFIVAGQTWARIRCLRNEAGVEISEAGPGTPVEIDGWREQPIAGDEVLQASDESKAKSVIDYRKENEERNKLAEDMEAINEFRKGEQEKREREKLAAEAAKAAKFAGEAIIPAEQPAKATGPKEICLIIKGDVSGSVEAVIDSVSAIGNQEVQPNIIRHGVGQVSEFDIEHASTAGGLVISFNTTVEPHITRLAEEKKVKILDFNIIYRLVDEVKAELSKHLPPLITQRVIGEAEVSQIFDITIKGRKQKPIAGCKVRNGSILKNERVRVLRNGEKIFDGHLQSLKNVKKDATEMKKGTECGMGFDGWDAFEVGDQIQTYEQKEEKRYL